MTTATLPEALAAHLLARIAEDDVPMNVAADIDQLIVEHLSLIGPHTTFEIHGHDGTDRWVLTDGFTTVEEAEAFITRTRWMRKHTEVHVVRRTSVEHHLPERTPA